MTVPSPFLSVLRPFLFEDSLKKLRNAMNNHGTVRNVQTGAQ
jgi:hypothetical protein